MFLKKSKELDSIDQTPLKKGVIKGKLVIKDNIAIIEPRIEVLILLYILNLLVVAFWVFVLI